jgi:lipopolysaccharide assembly LptE-like protein
MTRNCWIAWLAGAMVAVTALSGCTGPGGYSNETLFPKDVTSVRLEMFDNRSFRRGVEYELSDALAKRIEAETPYKIVSSRDRADSVISGQLLSISESALTIDREVAEPLESEVVLTAVVNWKNLNTGRLMINSKTVTAAASYSEFQGQDFTYASARAANKLAQRIVEFMENNW